MGQRRRQLEPGYEHGEVVRLDVDLDAAVGAGWEDAHVVFPTLEIFPAVRGE